MTPEQVQMLHQSFESIGPLSDRIGQSFYDKLFEIAPDARALFKTDIETQQRLFVDIFRQFSVLKKRSMLTLPVTDSDNDEVSIPGVVSLGERHIAYGVRPEHLAAAKEAFLWSLEKHLGDAADAETIEAWIRAFDMITQGMNRAMKSEATVANLPDADGRAVAEEGEEISLDQLFAR